jgi:hypothetical protein
MSGKWVGSKGTKDRTIAEFVHMWLLGKLGSGVALGELPDFIPWFRGHMKVLPECSRTLFFDAPMRLCFARTTCEGPVVPSLLAHLEQARIKDPCFVATLVSPEKDSFTHTALLLYGLLRTTNGKLSILVCGEDTCVIASTVLVKEFGKNMSVAKLTEFLVSEDVSYGAVLLADAELSSTARRTGASIYWPQMVHDKVLGRQALARQGEKEEEEGVEEIESEPESESEEDDNESRVGGSRKRGPSCPTNAAGPVGTSGQVEKRSCGNDVIQAENRPGGDTVEAMIKAYRQFTPEEKLRFQLAVELKSGSVDKAPKKPRPQKVGPPTTVPREIRDGRMICVTTRIEAIKKEMADKKGTPFPNVNIPPAWFLRMREKYHIREILGDLEHILIDALHDAYVYWIFFRRLICSIKKSDTVTKSGNVSKAIDVGGMVMEILHDMLPVFYCWSSRKNYAVSGGLLYVMGDEFIPFEETPFFKGGNIPPDVKECYTHTLAALTGQGWPLSLARHLAFLKTSRHPSYVEQAGRFILKSEYLQALGGSSVHKGLPSYLEEHPTLDIGYDMRAFRLDLNPPAYTKVPDQEMPDVFETPSDDEDAPPN